MDIPQNYRRVKSEIDAFLGACLVAVVKNQTPENIQKLIDAGAKNIAFGRVQEAEEKLPLLRFSGKVFFIGRLQKNKVKKAIRIFHGIHSVDSISLAQKISDECEKEQKKMPILLQVNISQDPDKTGFSPESLLDNLESLDQMRGIKICGLMTIGRFGIDESERRKEYRQMKRFFEEVKPLLKSDFTELSMGMSNDYQVALEEGATMVRVGSALFSSTEQETKTTIGDF